MPIRYIASPTRSGVGSGLGADGGAFELNARDEDEAKSRAQDLAGRNRCEFWVYAIKEIAVVRIVGVQTAVEVPDAR